MRELLERVHRSREATGVTRRRTASTRTVLVTGAAGFIGSALCPRLAGSWPSWATTTCRAAAASTCRRVSISSKATSAIALV